MPLPNEPIDPGPRPDADDDLVVTTLGTVSTPRGTRQLAPPAEMIDRYETRLSRWASRHG